MAGESRGDLAYDCEIIATALVQARRMSRAGGPLVQADVDAAARALDRIRHRYQVPLVGGSCPVHAAIALAERPAECEFCVRDVLAAFRSVTLLATHSEEGGTDGPRQADP